MRIVLNGEDLQVEDDTTVGALVDARTSGRRGVAVAIDGEVLARDAWDATTLDEGVRVELVGAVQGG